MHFSLLLALIPSVSAWLRPLRNTADFSKGPADPTIVCNLLKYKFTNLTYLPNDEGYLKESQGMRSFIAILPLCLLTTPQSLGMHRLGWGLPASSLPEMLKTCHMLSKL